MRPYAKCRSVVSDIADGKLDKMSAWMQTFAGILPWLPLVGALLFAVTLGYLIVTRWRDSRTRVKITYSVGEPE